MEAAAELGPPGDDDEGGGAGWIMTFADLMSLLMCFFVLLLSFAELDLMKFKAIAGSMKLAFGVQREIKAIEVPMGTSIVAQDFSAGKPQPTVINEVRQVTTDEDKQSLDFTDTLADSEDGDASAGSGESPAEKQAEADARALMLALKEEIEQGMIEIETEGVTVIIRIREKGSFPSGSARFDPTFTAVAGKLRQSLGDMDGRIAVAGHTDNIPIRTRQYRSNWDLSSARAVSVVHALLEDGVIEPARIVAEGHGEAHPLADNATAEGRALNRRVEISVRQEPGARPGVAAPLDSDPQGVAGDAAAAPTTHHADDDDAGEASGDASSIDDTLAAAPTAAMHDTATGDSATPPPLPVPLSAPSIAPPPINIAPSIFTSRPQDKPPSRIELIRQGLEKK